MISSILCMPIKAELFQKSVNTLEEMLPDTRSFKGNQGVTLYKTGDMELTLMTQWDTQADYENYIAWRTEKGDAAILQAFFADSPFATVCDTNQCLFQSE